MGRVQLRGPSCFWRASAIRIARSTQVVLPPADHSYGIAIGTRTEGTVKGVVFNLLEEFVTEQWGEDAYEEILNRCPLKNGAVFVGPETYPDADLAVIVTEACRQLGVAPDSALRAFGRFMFPRLAGKFPVFVKDHTHPRAFLKTIHQVIHVEVRKLMRDADPPDIRWSEPNDRDLVLTYSSRRGMCALMEGLLEGTADYFKTPIGITHTRCTRHGSPSCEFVLTFPTTLDRAS